MPSKPGPHITETVRRAAGLRSKGVLEELWREYPNESLWHEVLWALPGAERPSIAFIRAILRDRSANGKRWAKERELVSQRTGACAGCGAINCQGPDDPLRACLRFPSLRRG